MDKYCVDVVVTYNYYDDKFHALNMTHNVDLSIIDSEDKTTEISDFFYKSELIAVFRLKEFCPVLVSDAIQNITDMSIIRACLFLMIGIRIKVAHIGKVQNGLLLI